MLLQLLWIEMIAKAVAGGLLAIFPRTLARVMGLPAVGETFWPRLVGAMLLGLAAATFVEGQTTSANGLGLAGHVAVNLALTLAMISLMIMGKAGKTRWGRITLGVVVAALVVLVLFELAWV